MLYLATRARVASYVRERVRAFFFYVLAIGGVRFADAQHVVAIKITREEIIFTASRFKATKSDSVETLAVPLEGPGGHSFQSVAHELRAQIGDGFLLAHPSDATDVRSSNLEPGNGCSYKGGISLIQQFAAAFIANAHADDQFEDYGEITMHSLRSLLGATPHDALAA